MLTEIQQIFLKICLSPAPGRGFDLWRHRENNRERLRERAKLHARLPASREKAKAWCKNNPGKVKEIKSRCRKNREAYNQDQYRKRVYGISPERFQEMLSSQGGRCAICKKNPATDIDHCHATGRIRGILCDTCNRGLGFFKDCPEYLRSAAEYVT